MKVGFLCMILAVGGVPGVQAQGVQYLFKNYSVEQGLSQSTVYAIQQDSTGFLWLGTRDGLNRFDGHQFQTYYPRPQNTQQEERSIRALEKAGPQKLWVGTDGGGLLQFDTRSNTFNNMCNLVAPAECNSAENILSVYAGGQDIWGGTRENGLSKFTPAQHKSTRFLASQNVWAVTGDTSGRIYAGTDHALVVLNKSGEILHSFETGPVRALYFDEQRNHLFVGTDGHGLFVLEEGNSTTARHLQPIEALEGYSINAIAKGFEEDIWAGSAQNGLMALKHTAGTYEVHRSFKRPEKGYTGNPVRALYRDVSGMMWIGSNTSGVFTYSPFRTVFEHYGFAADEMEAPDIVLTFTGVNEKTILAGTEKSGLRIFDSAQKSVIKPDFLKDVSVITLHKDSKQMLWIGTDGLYYLPASGFPDFSQAKKISGLTNASVLYLQELENGQLLAGTYQGLNWIENQQVVKRFRLPPDSAGIVKDDRILAIEPHTGGSFWMGTHTGGMSYYDGRQAKFIHPDSTDYLFDIPSKRVNVIHKNEADELWVGTYNGLVRKQLSSGRVDTYNSDKKLPNSVVYGLLEDEQQNIWVSTNRGICSISMVSNETECFSTEDGLQSYEFNGGAYYRHTDGYLYFGGINGFNRFHPRKILKNTHRPHTAVTRFSVSGNPVDLQNGSLPVFDYRNNYYLFEFAAMDYNKPGKQDFRYRLAGLSDQWIETGGKSSVNFSGLRPGTYTFSVQGTNGDGLWGKTSGPVTFRIQPAFWQTTVFKTGLVLFLVIAIFAGYRYRLHYVLKEEKIRNRIARDLHDDLSATLSSISFFSEAAQKMQDENQEETIRFLSLIEEGAVESKEKINDIIWAIDPENDDWSVFLKKCTRFASDAFDSQNIEYKLDMADDFSFPVKLELRQNLWLIFKESINNLVRHSGATKAFVRLRQTDGYLELKIKDNGRGFNTGQNTRGHGLNNIRHRARRIGGELHIDSKPGEGTFVYGKFKT